MLAAYGQSSATAAPASATAAPAVAASLRGHIADPTGALIPGAAVTVTNAEGKTVATATADSSGAYRVNGLAAGDYIVQASYAGFAPFTSPSIQLAAGQVKRVDISMPWRWSSRALRLRTIRPR